MVAPDERLVRLPSALAQLVNVLRCDPQCQWTDKFDHDLSICSSLLANGFSEEDRRSLSRSRLHVYAGAGSFNDYVPGNYDTKTGRYSLIPGTERFENLANEVWDIALELA